MDQAYNLGNALHLNTWDGKIADYPYLSHWKQRGATGAIILNNSSIWHMHNEHTPVNTGGLDIWHIVSGLQFAPIPISATILQGDAEVRVCESTETGEQMI